jgi:hypothetical protein
MWHRKMPPFGGAFFDAPRRLCPKNLVFSEKFGFFKKTLTFYDRFARGPLRGS